MTTKQEEVAKEEGARSFSLFLQSFGDGSLHAELSETLRDAVKKLEEYAEDNGKARGVLTLNLTIGIERERGMVVIVPEVKTKMPRAVRKNGVFWVSKQGNLLPENPKQQKLPLAEVPMPRREVEAPGPR